MTKDDMNYCKVVASSICRALNRVDLSEDAAQEACMAFILAERKFDPTKGDSMMAYAAKRIGGAVRDYLRRETMVRLQNRPKFIHLDGRWSSKGEEGGRLENSSHILPPVVPHGTEGIEVERYLACLNNRPRLKDVIDRRFWGGELQADVAAALNVNYTRASQLEREAMCLLREHALSQVTWGTSNHPTNTCR